MKTFTKFSLAVVSCILFSGAAYSADNGQTAPQSALATASLETHVFLLDRLPKEESGVVSGWLHTFHSPNFLFTEQMFQENLRSNAQKFCAGGEWKLLKKKLETHFFEFAYACYDQKALTYKEAAIAQGLPRRVLD